KAILRCVEQDIKRKYTKAFLSARRFGDGPYIFPTELGNRISALDDYAQGRYCIDTAVLWDRLGWVLPKDAKAEVGDARLALETLINLALALALAGFLVLSVEGTKCTNIGWVGVDCNITSAAAFVTMAFVFSYFSYRGAVFAMEVLSTKMTALIDMYRL